MINVNKKEKYRNMFTKVLYKSYMYKYFHHRSFCNRASRFNYRLIQILIIAFISEAFYYHTAYNNFIFILIYRTIFHSYIEAPIMYM